MCVGELACVGCVRVGQALVYGLTGFGGLGLGYRAGLPQACYTVAIPSVQSFCEGVCCDAGDHAANDLGRTGSWSERARASQSSGMEWWTRASMSRWIA